MKGQADEVFFLVHDYPKDTSKKSAAASSIKYVKRKEERDKRGEERERYARQDGRDKSRYSNI